MNIGTEGLHAEIYYYGSIQLFRGGDSPFQQRITLSFEEFKELVRQGDGGMVEEMRKKTQEHLKEMICKAQERLEQIEGEG
jgi:hypothetical protein